jgi:hypothetical protein
VSVSSLGEPLRGLDIQGSLTRSCPHSRGPAGGKDRVFLRAPSELWASWWSVWAAFWLAAPSPAVATTTPADDSHTLARMLGKDLLNIVAQPERVPIAFRSKSVSRLSPTGTTGRVGSRPTSGPVDVDYVWHPFTSPNHSQPYGLVRLKDSLSRGPSFKPILTPRSTTPREPMLGSFSREGRRAAETRQKTIGCVPGESANKI